jgi:hypothetical protein
MTTWTATQTRQLPVFAAALPMARIEAAPCSEPEGRNGSGRRRT